MIKLVMLYMIKYLVVINQHENKNSITDIKTLYWMRCKIRLNKIEKDNIIVLR